MLPFLMAISHTRSIDFFGSTTIYLQLATGHDLSPIIAAWYQMSSRLLNFVFIPSLLWLNSGLNTPGRA